MCLNKSKGQNTKSSKNNVTDRQRESIKLFIKTATDSSDQSKKQASKQTNKSYTMTKQDPNKKAKSNILGNTDLEKKQTKKL